MHPAEVLTKRHCGPARRQCCWLFVCRLVESPFAYLPVPRDCQRSRCLPICITLNLTGCHLFSLSTQIQMGVYIGQYIISFPFTSPFVSVILRSCLHGKIKVVFHSDFGALASHETPITTDMASYLIVADECSVKRERTLKDARSRGNCNRDKILRSFTYYVITFQHAVFFRFMNAIEKGQTIFSSFTLRSKSIVSYFNQQLYLNFQCTWIYPRMRFKFSKIST